MANRWRTTAGLALAALCAVGVSLRPSADALARPWIDMGIKDDAALTQPIVEFELFELFSEWKVNAEKLLHIRNIEFDELGQGWRPRNKGGVHGAFELAEWDGERWLMPVMPTDGVRRGWLVIDDFIDRWNLL